MTDLRFATRSLRASFLPLSLCLLLFLPLLTSPSQAAVMYHFTDLGNLGPIGSSAYAINDVGQVTGGARTTGSRAFLWTPDTPNGTTGSMVDLDTLSQGSGTSAYSIGFGINSSGVVVGPSTPVGVSGLDAAYWTPSFPNGTTGSWSDIPRPPGTIESRAVGINASGQLAGRTFIGSQSSLYHAFLWTGGSSIDLPDFPGGRDDSRANGINNYGQVVGNGATASADRAFLWQPTSPNAMTGSMVEVNGLVSGSNTSQANGINSAGDIVGRRTFAPAVFHAYLWKPSTPNSMTGAATDLGDLGSGFGSGALGVNDSDEVVGEAYTAPSGQGAHGFIWTAQSGLIDLNTVVDADAQGWLISTARAINNQGQIVGEASLYSPGGQFIVSDAMLLTPIANVPEPAAPAALLCLSWLLPRLPLLSRRSSASPTPS